VAGNRSRRSRHLRFVSAAHGMLRAAITGRSSWLNQLAPHGCTAGHFLFVRPPHWSRKRRSNTARRPQRLKPALFRLRHTNKRCRGSSVPPIRQPGLGRPPSAAPVAGPPVCHMPPHFSGRSVGGAFSSRPLGQSVRKPRPIAGATAGNSPLKFRGSAAGSRSYWLDSTTSPWGLASGPSLSCHRFHRNDIAKFSLPSCRGAVPWIDVTSIGALPRRALRWRAIKKTGMNEPSCCRWPISGRVSRSRRPRLPKVTQHKHPT
jgi:hypothetical protein